MQLMRSMHTIFLEPKISSKGRLANDRRRRSY